MPPVGLSFACPSDPSISSTGDPSSGSVETGDQFGSPLLGIGHDLGAIRGHEPTVDHDRRTVDEHGGDVGELMGVDQIRDRIST